jgi:hypothetical protein
MYRVELKVDFLLSSSSLSISTSVPNVPCGVERFYCRPVDGDFNPFLMYRVELKVLLLFLYK